MNQKKIFNLKLYLQSLKQMKIIGIISTVLFTAISVFLAFNEAMSVKRMIALGYSDEGTRTIVDSLSQNYILFATFMIVTPLLTLYAWNFLTKRNMSDFYHALPYKRLCSYLSNIAAIITWQVIIILACAICSTVIYLFNMQYVIVDFGMLYRTYLMLFLCNLLCCSAISVACMLTGTLFSNICVSGLIIFLPRFIMMICTVALTSNIPFVVEDQIIPLFGQNSNIITGIVFSFFDGANVHDLSYKLIGNIYTFVLAVIYFIIAAVLYIRRKSEAAGKGAITRKMQFVIRTLIGFMVCSVGIMSIINEIRSTDPDIGRIITYIVITLVIAVIVLSIYECINMKSIRGAVKCLPSMLAAFVISVVYLFLLNSWMDQFIQYRPSADSLKHVSFARTTNYRNRNDYFENCSSNIKIKDEKIKELLCKALSDNLDQYEQNEHKFNIFTSDDSIIPLEVQYTKGIVPVYRTVYVKQQQLNELGVQLNQVDNFKTAYLNLPKAEETNYYWNSYGSSELKNDNSKKLYNKLLEESKSIDFDKWYKAVNAYDSDLKLNCDFMREGRKYTIEVPITEDLPETKVLYYQMLNQENIASPLRQELADVISSYCSGLKYPAAQNISMCFVDPESVTQNNLNIDRYIGVSDENGKDTLAKIADNIENLSADKKIDMARPFIIVSYYSTGDKTEDPDKANNDYYSSEKLKSTTFVIQLDGYDHITDYYPIGK